MKKRGCIAQIKKETIGSIQIDLVTVLVFYTR